MSLFPRPILSPLQTTNSLTDLSRTNFFAVYHLNPKLFFFNSPSPSIKTNTKKKTSFYNKSKWYFFSLFSRSTHVFIADGPFLKTKGVN